MPILLATEFPRPLANLSAHRWKHAAQSEYFAIALVLIRLLGSPKPECQFFRWVAFTFAQEQTTLAPYRGPQDARFSRLGVV